MIGLVGAPVLCAMEEMSLGGEVRQTGLFDSSPSNTLDATA